jgi:hypothetical protein
MFNRRQPITILEKPYSKKCEHSNEILQLSESPLTKTPKNTRFSCDVGDLTSLLHKSFVLGNRTYPFRFKSIEHMASSAGGSELFSSYEQDFTTISDSIRSKIEQQIPNQKGGNYTDR